MPEVRSDWTGMKTGEIRGSGRVGRICNALVVDSAESTCSARLLRLLLKGEVDRHRRDDPHRATIEEGRLIAPLLDRRHSGCIEQRVTAQHARFGDLSRLADDGLENHHPRDARNNGVGRI